MYLNETVYPTSLLSLTESRHQKLSQLFRIYKINKKTHYFILYDNLLSLHAQKKTALSYKTVFFLAFDSRSALGDSIIGANLCAAAAADTSVRIDFVDISFRDSVYRTYRHASAACDAVVANYVSHNLIILFC